MFNFFRARNSKHWSLAFLSLALLGSDHFVATSNAQQTTEMASAKLVPMDADLYAASIRLREQWDGFVAGPVVKKFFECSAVDELLEQFRFEWSEKEGFGLNARIFLENPNTKEALAFMEDLFSSEIFLMGDKNVSPWYSAQGTWNDHLRSLALNRVLTAQERSVSPINAFLDIAKGLTIPTVMLGARCKNEDLALGKIDQIEAAIQFGAAASPEVALFFKNLDRVNDARGDRLQLRLDGSQIQWDSIPTNEAFDEESKDKVREFLSTKSMTISIGMFDGFFIVGVSQSAKSLLELGKGQSILEHPDMKPVRDAAASELVSVSYASDAMNKSNFDANLKNFFSRFVVSNVYNVVQLLEEDSDVRDFVTEIVKDCVWIDDSIAKFVPEFKGGTSIAYLTEDGWERHDYPRTANAIASASAPLISLEHMGANPMMFSSFRLQDRPEYFQLSRKIVQKMKSRFDEACELDWTDVEEEVLSLFGGTGIGDIGERLVSTKEQLEIGWPFLVRAADTWEKKFLPSFTGEYAMVMSGGNLSATQWFADMAQSADPLPMPELALVIGVKDQSLLKSAFEDTLKIGDDIVEAMRKQDPDSIPAGYRMPRPVMSESSAGEKFGYPIPDDCPVPKEMMPQILFAGDYLIESYSDQQSLDLAAVKKLSKGSGVIEPTAQLSSASYINVGRIFDFARPWVRYSLTESLESLDDSLLDGALLENYDLTGKDLLSAWSILSAIGEFSSVSRILPDGGIHIRSVYKSQKSN